MYNLICADLYKFRKTITVKVLFIITAVSALLVTFMAYFIQQGDLKSSISGMGFLFSDMSMISILGAVIAGTFISGDFDNKIIHDAVANGNSRGTVIISKTLTFFGAVAFIIVPYVISVIIAIISGSRFSTGSQTAGFLNLLISSSGSGLSAPEVLKLIVIIITLVIVYAAQLSVCVPLAIGFRKPILIVAIYYGFQFLCGQLVTLKDSSPALYDIFSLTPYGGVNYSLTLNSGAGDILKAISVSIIFIIAMISVTYLTFRKTEIK